MPSAELLLTLTQRPCNQILDGVALGTAHRAESHDPSVVEGDHNIEKEVCVTTG